MSTEFKAGESVEVQVRSEDGTKFVWIRATYSKLTPQKLHSVVLPNGKRRAFPNPSIRKISG